jgi:hypothetical protein
VPAVEDAQAVAPSRTDAAPARATLGRLSGRIEIAPAAAAPARWQLEAHSSDGTGRAEVVEGTGDARDFSLELAPGAWRVRAQAPGLRSFLEEIQLAADAEARVVLTLRPLVAVGGAVVQENEDPVEGLTVTLARAGAEPALSTLTDPGGRFALDGIVQGSYELVLGDVQGPLLPPRALELDAAFVDLEHLIVPLLGSVRLSVVDQEGAGVAGARFEGVGAPGGRLAGETDAEGRATARLLPGGEYRVFADHPGIGRGNRAFALAPGEELELVVELRTQRP